MSEEAAPMSAKMRRFMARPPKRISPERVAARRTSAVRRSKPKGWLAELCAVQCWRCAYCQQHMCKKEGPRQATLDHMLPVSRGGRNQWNNLAAACRSCNQAKGSLTVEEFAALAGEAATAAETTQIGSVHEHATAQPERPNPPAILPNKERPR